MRLLPGNVNYLFSKGEQAIKHDLLFPRLILFTTMTVLELTKNFLCHFKKINLTNLSF